MSEFNAVALNEADFEAPTTVVEETVTKAKYDEDTTRLRNAYEYASNQRKGLEENIESVREYLIENLDGIGEDYANAIASLLDVELTTEYVVTFNITWTANVTAMTEDDARSMAEETGFSMDSGDYDYDSYDIDSIEVEAA